MYTLWEDKMLYITIDIDNYKLLPVAVPSIVVSFTVTSLSKSVFLFSTTNTTTPEISSTEYSTELNPISATTKWKR